MPVARGPHVSHRYAVAVDDLAVEHERLGIEDAHLGEAAHERPRLLDRGHRLPTDEVLVPVDREAETYLERRVCVVDVVAEVAVGLLHAQ